MIDSINELEKNYQEKKSNPQLLRKIISNQLSILKLLDNEERIEEGFLKTIELQVRSLDVKNFSVDLEVYLQILREKDAVKNLDYLLLNALQDLKDKIRQLREIILSQKSSFTQLLLEEEGKLYPMITELHDKLQASFSGADRTLLVDYYNNANKLKYNKKKIDSGRKFIQVISKGVIRKIIIENLENLPKNGPCILMPRHYSAATDPIVLMSSIPRRVYFMSAVDFYMIWPIKKLRDIMKKFMLGLGVQFVKRDHVHFLRNGFTRQGSDKALAEIQAEDVDNNVALENLRIHLKHGDAVVIFPEGDDYLGPYKKEENYIIKPLHPGAIAFAIRSSKKLKINIPIIPIGINHSAGMLGIKSQLMGMTNIVKVRIGKPILVNYSEQIEPKLLIETITQELISLSQ